MQSGYEIPGIHHHQRHRLTVLNENTSQNSSEFNPYGQNYHLLPQTQNLQNTQQLFQGQNHFQAAYYQERQRALEESYSTTVEENISSYVVGGGTTVSVPPFFQLDLNHHHESTGANIISFNKGTEDALLRRGSEQYDVPETPLPTPHLWQNRQDSSAIHQQCFLNWKPLAAATASGDEEKQGLMNPTKRGKFLERENDIDRVYGSELEAIYKPMGTSGSNQTASGSVKAHNYLQAGSEEVSTKKGKTRKKRKMKNQLDSMASFLESLVKHVMEHQERLHRKFTEVIERLDQERREREETWRKQEMDKLEREAATRAREKALATSREAAIVSYLEKITGQTINLPPLIRLNSTQNPLFFCNSSSCPSDDDVGGRHDPSSKSPIQDFNFSTHQS